MLVIPPMYNLYRRLAPVRFDDTYPFRCRCIIGPITVSRSRLGGKRGRGGKGGTSSGIFFLSFCRPWVDILQVDTINILSAKRSHHPRPQCLAVCQMPNVINGLKLKKLNSPQSRGHPSMILDFHPPLPRRPPHHHLLCLPSRSPIFPRIRQHITIHIPQSSLIPILRLPFRFAQSRRGGGRRPSVEKRQLLCPAP